MLITTKMAATCTTLVRSVLKGVHLVPGRLRCHNTPVCLRLMAAQCRPFHLSPAASLSSTTESHRTAGTQRDDRKTKEEEEEYDYEYIPRKQAKHPMMKIGYAWMIGLPAGVIGFLLTKRQVDKNRLKQLKIRQRMKRSNEGEYERSRYHSAR